MRRKQTSASPTQHALLAIWVEYAQHLGLVKEIHSVPIHQKERTHSAQRKVLEMLVATLAGLPHLQDISRSAHPLDQDQALAEAWGQTQWADYSGVSRTLQTLSLEEAQQIRQRLQRVSQAFIDAEVALSLEQEGRLIYDGDLTGLPVSKSSTTYPEAAYGHMDDAIRLGYQAAVVSLRSLTYQRLWLSIEHHPGNTLSSQQAAALVLAAEASTGRRPWRRVDLLAQRLTHPDGSVEAANPAACAMFRWSEEEIRNLGRSGLLDLNDTRLAAALEERQRTGRFQGREYTAIHKGGERFPVEVDSVILEGDPDRSFVILRDISERKRAILAKLL